MIEANSIKFVDQEKLINSLKAGINPRLRGKIWILLSRTLDAAMNHNENLFYKLVNTKDESLDNNIMRDIKRTILYTYKLQSKEVFKIDISEKHQKLFNILKAYAIYDSEVSYTQGTNYIVGVILSNINSERACFWTLVQIMNEKKFRDIFKINTPKLMRLLDILKEKIKEVIPELFEYFVKLDFVEYFPAVFSQYFVTLFSYNVPIEYANRVIDLFWIYEEKIIFDCLIHILEIQKAKLVKLELDELFPFIRDKIVIDCINSHGLENSLPFGARVEP